MKKLSFFAFWTLLKILLSSFGSHQCYCNSQLFTLHFLPEKLYIADPGIFSLRKFYPNYALYTCTCFYFFSCNFSCFHVFFHVFFKSGRLFEFLVMLSDFLKLLLFSFNFLQLQFCFQFYFPMLLLRQIGLLERLLGNQKLSLDLGNQNFGICNQEQFFLQMKSFIASYSSSYTWSIFLSGKNCLKKLQSIRGIAEKSFHEVKVETLEETFFCCVFFLFFHLTFFQIIFVDLE